MRDAPGMRPGYPTRVHPPLSDLATSDRARPRRAIAVAVGALIAAASGGCSLSAGPQVVQRLGPSPATLAGARAAAIVHPFGSRGLAISGAATGLADTDGSHGSLVGELGVAYDMQPSPWTSSVGLSIGLGLKAGADMPPGGTTAFVYGPDVRVGLPIRLSGESRPWQVHTALTETHIVVPEIALYGLRAPWSDHDGCVWFVSFSLSYRYGLWPSVVP
ncbi:MAG: hypothetical protein ACHREM_03425 [Polyangiales bacterium]